MAIRTQQSISGFIASDPQLTHTAKGSPRFYARIGQEHFRHEDDGTFTRLEPTFHDLVAFRATAERAHERFAKATASSPKATSAPTPATATARTSRPRSSSPRRSATILPAPPMRSTALVEPRPPSNERPPPAGPPIGRRPS